MSQKAPEINVEHPPEDDHDQASGSEQMSTEDQVAEIKNLLEGIEKPELRLFIAKEEEEELSRCKTTVDAKDTNEPEISEKLKKAKKLVKAIQKRVAEHKFAVSSLQNLITGLKTLVDNFDQESYEYIKPAVKSCLKIQWENTDAWFKKTSAKPIEAGKTKKELEQIIGEYVVMKRQLFSLFDSEVKKLDGELSKNGAIYLGVERKHRGRSRSQHSRGRSKSAGSRSSNGTSRSGSRCNGPQHGHGPTPHGRVNEGCSPFRPFEPPFSWAAESKDLPPPRSRSHSSRRK